MVFRVFLNVMGAPSHNGYGQAEELDIETGSSVPRDSDPIPFGLVATATIKKRANMMNSWHLKNMGISQKISSGED